MRTKMTKVKMNMNNSEQNWMCDSCETAIDSQSHVLGYPAYAKIREGKDLSSDIDLIEYFDKVMSIRTELKLKC